ncbi:6856_t:CDS:2 [Gigaspora margarita]|uniref:6856_t:CDS:1 n=1 Tax=Gigaspora margarita TaxID=4874 RepID=A0ABN7VD61_GIGMA|nr:6856_t:CDS:2 [Gigaspora margarita]
MNKKLSHYLLIVLIAIIVIPNIASVISQRNNIMLPFVSVVNPNHNYPIGFFLADDGSTEDVCTASVINTANGNIGLTAAHCLLDENGNRYNLSLLSFSPGYDNGTNGPLGDIPVADIAMPNDFLINRFKYDYALARFEFNDPNGGNATLQDYTGALGWRFDIGNGEPTSVYGYPYSGNFEDCDNDGEHLCKWQGITEKREIFYAINNITTGEGLSGGPFISQYDTETNLGYVYALMRGYYSISNASVGSIWDENVFFDLLLQITP